MELLWSTEGVRFATGPIGFPSADAVVALAAVDGGLELHAYDMETGEELWTRPSTASQVTLGVELVIPSRREAIFHLAPGPDGGDLIEAVDVTTGEPLWTTPESPDGFNDPLYLCQSDTDTLCVTAGGEDADSGGWQIDMDTGVTTGPNGIVSLRARPRQTVGEGRALGAGLFHVYDSDEIVRMDAGQVVWRRPARDLFGGADVSPDFGWSFRESGGLIVGWLGSVVAEQSDGEVEIPVEHIAGIDEVTGETRWLTEGYIGCEQLNRLDLRDAPLRSSPWLRCRPTGTAILADDELESVTLTSNVLEGFDPATGAAVWSVDTGAASALWDDERPLVRLSPTSFALTKDDGTLLGVDIRDGTVLDITAEDVGWCRAVNRYDYADSSTGDRVGHDFATPCSVDGTPLAVPADAEEDLGIVVRDVFVWMDEAGLHGARMPG
jgi:outer membrane protein assembly factor BamB